MLKAKSLAPRSPTFLVWVWWSFRYPALVALHHSLPCSHQLGYTMNKFWGTATLNSKHQIWKNFWMKIPHLDSPRTLQNHNKSHPQSVEIPIGTPIILRRRPTRTTSGCSTCIGGWRIPYFNRKHRNQGKTRGWFTFERNTKREVVPIVIANTCAIQLIY